MKEVSGAIGTAKEDSATPTEETGPTTRETEATAAAATTEEAHDVCPTYEVATAVTTTRVPAFMRAVIATSRPAPARIATPAAATKTRAVRAASLTPTHALQSSAAAIPAHRNLAVRLTRVEVRLSCVPFQPATQSASSHAHLCPCADSATRS